MAESLKITDQANGREVFIDGNKIEGVTQYTLHEEAHEVPYIDLRVSIAGEIDVRR